MDTRFRSVSKLTKKMVLGCISFTLAVSINVNAGPIEDLQPGHWLEVPNSNMSQVYPSPAPVGGHLRNVINAWNGGAYDTKRDRLIIWGGGHADYSGNEIYAFDVNTLSWERLTDADRLRFALHGDQRWYRTCDDWR